MHSKICPSCMAEVQKNEDSCPICGWQFPKVPTKSLKPDSNKGENAEETSTDTSYKR
ncbi:MAG: hypothetical protein K8S87_06970 [Planctomycetes bacterium]|nr:hypothetical protein [Planctomycetota bacterium]